MFLPAAGTSSPFDSNEAGYPVTLETQIQELRKAHATLPNSPNLLTQLATVYLDAGDDLYREKDKRIEAYQTGADFAKQALVLDETRAQAHFLYAANLGHSAQLKGVLVSAFLIREIKAHVEQSIALEPNHAPALHMMGMILDGLPWFLGGDEEGAIDYLERAVVADPNYTHARLNLGKLYVKQGRLQAAKKQFALIIDAESPRGRYAWSHRHNPEALRLLKQLESQG